MTVTASDPLHAQDPRTQAEIVRVRASGVLGESGRMNELFDFLVERSAQNDAPKETEIALAVFGKDEAAGARDDATARVYVHRLRKRLEDFYLRNGAPSGIRLEIPKGEYRIVGSPAIEEPTAAAEDDPAVAAPGSEQPAVAPPRKRRWLAPVAAALACVVVAGNVAAWAAFANGPSDRATTIRNSSVWSDFSRDQRPLLIVVGDYYIFGEYQDRLFLKRLVRDFSINSKSDLLQRYGSDPKEWDHYGDVALEYLPTSAAFALADLAPLFSGNRPVQVVLASELTPDKIKTNDILYIGLLSGMGDLKNPVFANSRFSIGESYDELVDRETSKTYTSEAFLSAPEDTMYRDFGYFSSFKGPSGNRIAIVAGERDTALMGVAESLSKAGSLDALGKPAKDGGSFEALFEIKGQKQVNLETRILATSRIDSAAIWTGAKANAVSFPAE
ncbi:MAG: hypothetical protein GC155_07165 [Alphaproteobacteria bacterium]|nr:hypothetical protein [Alphaproteobacteria bacterium]